MRNCLYCASPFVERGTLKKYCRSNCSKQAWKKRNPDNARELYVRDRERILSVNRVWRQANAKKKQAANRAWYKANPERGRAMYRRWRLANPEQMRACRNSWDARNPERRLEISNKRRAIKEAATLGDISLITKWRQSWRAKSQAMCFWCRESFPSKQGHADHIIPLTKGGAHSVENLCISCPACNFSKSAQDVAAWNNKLSEPILL